MDGLQNWSKLTFQHPATSILRRIWKPHGISEINVSNCMGNSGKQNFEKTFKKWPIRCRPVKSCSCFGLVVKESWFWITFTFPLPNHYRRWPERSLEPVQTNEGSWEEIGDTTGTSRAIRFTTIKIKSSDTHTLSGTRNILHVQQVSQWSRNEPFFFI